MEKDIAVNYNAFQTKKGNIVWCGVLSLCWQSFAKTYKQKSLEFKTQSHQALTTIKNFNKSPFSDKDIDHRSIYVKTGKGKATQTLINKEVKAKFPKCSFPDLDYDLYPEDIISYSYLFKQLNFAQKFTRRKVPTFVFNGQKVSSFYAENEGQKKQISVCYYKNRNNFLIHIGDKLTNDTLYILKNEKSLTVDEVLKKVAEQEKKGGLGPMKKKDLFEMPVVEVDCMRSYQEMVGLHFSNEPLKDYVLAVMMEAIKLKIDETGAKVEARGVMMALKCCVKPDIDPPREFIVDKTFWIVMKESGQHPYVCM